MFFHQKESLGSNGTFRLPQEGQAIAHPSLNKEILREFWHHFSFGLSTVTMREADTLSFCIGEAAPTLPEGGDYAISITKTGLSLSAVSEEGLVHGYLTLLDLIEAGEEGAELPCCYICEKAQIARRMVHFCIFPDTELWELDKFVRLCGALKYTHLVLEFWGMLQYDCMRELAWPHAFRKEEIRPIIATARALGLQVIPMFNHWGHASASRVMHGKHVVLDQNPGLQSYFNDTGWCWDIRRDKVRALLRAIRSELIELCGPGDYFHIGCDEAYGFTYSTTEMDFICDFLNEVSGELAAMGRRAIMWGDMLVYNRPTFTDKRYTAAAPSEACEQYMLSRLDKRLVIADWQYDAKTVPIETALVFRQAGFDCLLCPFNSPSACIQTIKQEGLFGLLHTTWHILSSGMPQVASAALLCMQEKSYPYAELAAQTAALQRKACPINGDYRRAGWAKYEIGVNT